MKENLEHGRDSGDSLSSICGCVDDIDNPTSKELSVKPYKVCCKTNYNFNSINFDDSEVLTTLLSNKWRSCDEIATILEMKTNLVQKSLDRLLAKGIIEFDEQTKTYYRRLQK
jgi:biotin operon repressor